MLLYFIKSSFSYAVFLLFYSTFLQKEKMHSFNRYYLLIAVLFSAIIPLITIETTTKNTVTHNLLNLYELTQNSRGGKNFQFESQWSYFETLFYAAYSFVFFILSFRFIKNINSIVNKINQNKKVSYDSGTLILLNEDVEPHTFLNFIFINKAQFNDNKIRKEVLTHELTHVSQKHTLDILFIEFVCTLFWFNPLVYKYKKAIQLNHEFIADEMVINTYNNSTIYQTLLLETGTNNKVNQFASNFNYLTTKKRLVMMTKKSNSMVVFIKKVSALAVFLVLISLCSTKVEAQNTAKPAVVKGNTIAAVEVSTSEWTDNYFSGVQIIIKDKKGKVLVDKMYEKLTEEEKKKYLDIVPPTLVSDTKSGKKATPSGNLPSHFPNKKLELVIGSYEKNSPTVKNLKKK
jgi:hypothetical protein